MERPVSRSLESKWQVAVPPAGWTQLVWENRRLSLSRSKPASNPNRTTEPGFSSKPARRPIPSLELASPMRPGIRLYPTESPKRWAEAVEEARIARARRIEWVFRMPQSVPEASSGRDPEPSPAPLTLPPMLAARALYRGASYRIPVDPAIGVSPRA